MLCRHASPFGWSTYGVVGGLGCVLCVAVDLTFVKFWCIFSFLVYSAFLQLLLVPASSLSYGIRLCFTSHIASISV
jgi:hypothetical protein